MDDYNTYFQDENGKSVGGNLPFILPCTLSTGMKMTFHGVAGKFEVVEWNFHLGQGDEKPGLRVILKPAIKSE